MSHDFITHPTRRRWHPLTSSFLLATAFNWRAHELHVEMHSKGEPTQAYVAFGVPRRVFKELRQDPSPGRYFNENIKGRYRMIPRTLPLLSELPKELQAP